MCDSRRDPGAEREPRGNRRLSVACAVHKPTRSESEGEPSGGAAISSPKPKLAPPQNNYIVGSGANSPCSGGGSEVLKLSVPVRSISRSPKRVNSR